MTDRADEIAAGIAVAHVVEPYISELREEIADALRSYGNERLEEAAVHLDMSGTTSPVQSMEPAAKLVRSLKSSE